MDMIHFKTLISNHERGDVQGGRGSWESHLGNGKED